jgi:transposase-like protein
MCHEFPLNGEVEVDESYLSAKRLRGKRGRGSYGKTIVFGILERNGMVYTEIVPDCSLAMLQVIIRSKVEVESVIKWRGYNEQVDIGYTKNYRVDHRGNKFSSGRVYINGIEPFWSFAKRRLQKFNGVHRENFNLHLKKVSLGLTIGIEVFTSCC